MNTITHAFKASGVKLPPLNKRVWLWLHDHPGKTAKEVATAIGAKQGDVSSTMGNMVKRRMVVQGQGHRRPGAPGWVTYYTTCINVFELLPMPSVKVAKQSPFSPQMPLPLVEQPRPAVMLPPVPKPVMSVLENYTLKELRVIRDALNKLFEFV